MNCSVICDRLSGLALSYEPWLQLVLILPSDGCYYVLAYQGGTCSIVAVTLRVQMHSARWQGDDVTMLDLTPSVDGDLTVLRFRSKFSKSNCPKYSAIEDLKHYLRIDRD